ncbi:Flp pilus assembly protein CpaB [Alcanivorax sp.]|uniref:Flp pilus assembly protein CpaB n=1 Tax=Alcanivorax sp. TaxID=1872427 RepID=UPI000C112D41|nr:Flp pilus assembly protein CpaB [Alcanivorax sp.]PHR68105.1 MAG: Flp pilus assembly protein CpaB [Alcanivorax sp.]
MGARWLYMLPALILSVVAVILALIGLARDPAPPEGGASGMVMQVTEEQIEEALKHSYWVATRELNIGDTITEDDFRKVGVSVPLAAAVDADTVITDKLLRRNVREGEILAKSHLEASNRLAQAVPAGFRAFAVAIDNTSAVGGLLEPGDLVDVLAHFRKGQDEAPTALILLNGIEVLAVKGRLQDAPTEEGEQRSRNRNSTAVLAIPREDLPRLLLADSNGELRLAMAGEARDHDEAEGDEEGSDKVAKKEQDKDAISLTTKLDTLFPQKRQPVRRAAPKGDKVEVYEGSTSRSTYVH